MTTKNVRRARHPRKPQETAAQESPREAQKRQAYAAKQARIAAALAKLATARTLTVEATSLANMLATVAMLPKLPVDAEAASEAAFTPERRSALGAARHMRDRLVWITQELADPDLPDEDVAELCDWVRELQGPRMKRNELDDLRDCVKNARRTAIHWPLDVAVHLAQQEYEAQHPARRLNSDKLRAAVEASCHQRNPALSALARAAGIDPPARKTLVNGKWRQGKELRGAGSTRKRAYS